MGWATAYAQETPQAQAAQQALFAGQDDMDDAMRGRLSYKNLSDLQRVVQQLNSALDKGLGPENTELARLILSDTLMERATTLVRAVNARSLSDPRVQKIRKLAVSDLRHVLDLDDPPVEANYLLGRLMAMPGGDGREAMRALTRFLDSDEVSDQQRAEALVLRASLHPSETKALADFEQAIQLAPEKTNYRLARAVYLQKKNRSDDALQDIQALLEKDPEDTNVLIFQGALYRQLGRTDDAIASFDQATKLSPKSPSPYQSRGEIYRQLKEYDLAAEQFSMVLKLKPGVLLTLVHRAEAYLAGDRLEEALADVEIVLEKQKGLISAHKLRAAVLAKMNRLNEAVEEMERLAEAVPNQPALQLELAMYYLIQEKPLRAIQAYDAVLAANADNFLALRSRGDAYLNLGRHEKAIADFEGALKLEPEDTALLNNLAWVLATSPQDAYRDGRRAIELATKACELTSFQTPHVLSTLAASYAESGDFESAIKWSEKAVQIGDPEHDAQLVKELSAYRQKEPWRELQGSPEEQPKAEPESPQDAQPQVDETVETLEF